LIRRRRTTLQTGLNPTYLNFAFYAKKLNWDISTILLRLNIDGFVKSLKTSFSVIPAKAGIQYFQMFLDACRRMHGGVSGFLRVCQY
jgi:hypothetical protein